VTVVQPDGSVTLVFTDIEGSTRLLRELGEDGYLRALLEHRDWVRNAFGRYRGYEVECEGNAFFYAFASPADAVQPGVVAPEWSRRAGWPVALRSHSGLESLWLAPLPVPDHAREDTSIVCDDGASGVARHGRAVAAIE
jgi:class 3 adenylate cyclase